MAIANQEIPGGSVTITPEDAAAPQGDDAQQVEAELIGGKFRTNEDLLQAYKELERKLHSGGAQEAEEAPATNEPPPPLTIEAPAEEAEAAAPVDFGKYTSEFVSNGSLSEESYAEIAESLNLPRDMVDTYLVGLQTSQTSLMDAVGGADEYRAMSEWASTNLSDADLAAYNEVVSAGNASATKLAMQGLQAQYIAATGSQGTMVYGRTASSTPTNTFQSQAQVTEAMNDPRYARDPAYRQEVADRLRHSTAI